MKNGLLIVAGAVIVFLLMMWWKQRQELQQQSNTIQVLSDSTAVFKNELGQTVATMKQLEIQSTNQLKDIQTRDEALRRLVDRIQAYEKSRGKVGSATTIDGFIEDKGVSVTRLDTNNIAWSGNDGFRFRGNGGDGVVQWPIYKTEWSDKWSRGVITATKDSIYRDVKVLSSYDLITGWKRKNIFNPYVAEVQVVNLNPNIITTDVRSISIVPPRSKIHVGAGITYNVNPNNLNQSGFGVSVGVFYSLFGL